MREHRLRRMRRASRLLLAVALLALTPACHHVAYQTRLPGGGRVQKKQLDYWFWGLRGKHDVDLDELCPEGVASFRTEDSWFGLIDFATLGIYTPRTLIVECTGAGVRR